MRDPQAQHHSPEESRFQPTLGHCLMDSDPEVQRLARANRRRSMLLSTLIQVSLLTAAIVLPLFASQTIPGFRNEPRLPAPKGIRIANERPPADPGQRPPGKHPSNWGHIVPPREIPTVVTHINDRVESGPPNVPGGRGCSICSPDGVPGLDPTVFSELTERPPFPRPPVVESKPAERISVSKGVQEARLIRRVEPIYPILAKQTRREGTVELRAIIAKDGSVQYLEVVSGHPLFIEASKLAVLQWRYQPTLLNGEPVEVDTRITVHFILSR